MPVFNRAREPPTFLVEDARGVVVVFTKNVRSQIFYLRGAVGYVMTSLYGALTDDAATAVVQHASGGREDCYGHEVLRRQRTITIIEDVRPTIFGFGMAMHHSLLDPARAAGRIAGHWPRVRDTLDPVGELAVNIVDIMTPATGTRLPRPTRRG